MGDRNTTFFHAKASARHKKNFIEGLLDAEVVWQTNERRVEEIVVEYYKTLFTSSNPTDFTELVQEVQPKVSATMNHMLLSDFTTDECRRALKQMYPLKAPGPGGMPPLFFQRFWSTCGEVVTKTVLDFLDLHIVPPNFNETHIVFIPKIQETKKTTDFRPINLCNVVYKIASKAIPNRLKKILPSIISDT